MINKFLLALMLFSGFAVSSVHAQFEADTSENLNISELEELEWMMDTCYKILKRKRFSEMRIVYPSFKTYKKFIDKSMAGDQSDITQYTMYNYFWNRLRLQHTKLMKKALKSKLDWKTSTLDSIDFKHSYEEKTEFAYVTWYIKAKNKKYIIKATCLKMDNKWFVMDELKYIGVFRPKKAKQKK